MRCVKVAAKIHQPAVFNLLIAAGMDEHSPDENQKTAATTVLTRRGSEEYALSVDVDNLADRLGWTLLHQAAALTQQGRKLTDAVLESAHEYIDSRDTLGRTPLHWLAENGETESIRLLTSDPWCANVQLRDNCGFTPLHCACWADSLDSAAVLLDAGSDPNAKDKHERTPMLHLDDFRILQLLIDRCADVFIIDDEGCNIMHHVAVSDQAGLARILLKQYGDSLHISNYTGDTPLGLAIQNNSIEVLAVMLSYASDFPVSAQSLLVILCTSPSIF
jgi:ankyrin repeat protein